MPRQATKINAERGRANRIRGAAAGRSWVVLRDLDFIRFEGLSVRRKHSAERTDSRAVRGGTREIWVRCQNSSLVPSPTSGKKTGPRRAVERASAHGIDRPP